MAGSSTLCLVILVLEFLILFPDEFSLVTLSRKMCIVYSVSFFTKDYHGYLLCPFIFCPELD
jgi:hypothetical protein